MVPVFAQAQIMDETTNLEGLFVCPLYAPPTNLEEGKLYYSEEYEFAAIHLCPCGCRGE